MIAVPWRWPRQHGQVRVPVSAPSSTAGSLQPGGHETMPGHTIAASLEISHAQMNDAICNRTAVLLGRGLWWIARYLDAWWVEYEGGWLRVTDDHVTAELDDMASRLAEAATSVSEGFQAPRADTQWRDRRATS